LQFGNFRFDAERGLLTHGAQCLALSPKALEVLAVLVKNAGHVVSKDDLLDIIWPDTPVEEGNLAVHVFALRRALEEFDDTAAYIETIPKRGYRFAVPISPRDEVTKSTNEDQTCDLPKIAEHLLELQNTGAARRATAAYRTLVARDPANAKARIGLANALLFRFGLGDQAKDEAVQQAQKLLGEASAIDPNCAELHLIRSILLGVFCWQWEKGREELQRAQEGARNDCIRAIVTACRGQDFVGLGEFESGLAELRRASEAFPLSSHIWRMRAEACFLAGDFAGSAAVSRKALQLHPACVLLYRALGRALIALGEYDGARRYFRRALVLNSGPQVGLVGEIAYLDAVAGNRDNAVGFLERQQQSARGQHVSRVLLAEIYAALGNKERALDYVEQACLTGDFAAPSLKHNSRLNAVRYTPRYRSIVAGIGS
jgi:DNA-binding winged helix-turn-helix (wHTH) protein/Tfp pilus assembly protein PilF